MQQERPSVATRADTFHKPGFKMHVKILHHLFGVVSSDVIKAPLWDVAALGPAAYPSNAVFVHHHVTQLLTTSFPNMRAQQVEVRRALLCAPEPSCTAARRGTKASQSPRHGVRAPPCHAAAEHLFSQTLCAVVVRSLFSAPCYIEQ